MPKGGKSKRKKEKPQDVTLSPEDDDTESVCSSQPDSTISDEISSDTLDDTDSDGDLQFQLSEHIDQLLDKNSKTRLSSLKFLNELFRRRNVSHLLMGREETVSDVLIRGLRKSGGQERCDLLITITLVALQFGQELYPLFVTLNPILLAIIKDHTVTPLERSSAITTVTILCFILSQDFQEVQSIMHECESIMHGVKNDTMVTASVKGWSLLLSVTPNHVIPNILSSELPHLSNLLSKCVELSVKTAIGQAIVLLLEIARDTDETLMDLDEVDVAYDVIQSLASESNRYTGRKERSQQRSCFKDMVSSVETGDVPERRVKFGSEILLLDSWSKLVQYSFVTELLETGTVNHLQSNDLLRDIFQLGAPPILDSRQQKVGKIEKKLHNAACAKYRSQARGKQRDKRSVIM